MEMIKNIENNTDKYDTYRSLTAKHITAMKHGFFFEALLIDYAMLEDRLEAFLWAAGVMNDPGLYKLGNKNNKDTLRDMYNSYVGEIKQTKLSNISAKIAVSKMLIDFGKTDYTGDSKYLQALNKALHDLDLDKLDSALSQLDDWRQYRNEVIHGAMSKNVYSLFESLEEKAKAGFEYARIIDNESKKLKRRQYVRKSVRMPLMK